MCEYLKPCPFCGGKPYLRAVPLKNALSISCQCDCGVKIQSLVRFDSEVKILDNIENSKNNVIEAWNRRQ